MSDLTFVLIYLWFMGYMYGLGCLDWNHKYAKEKGTVAIGLIAMLIMWPTAIALRKHE